jgi:hypothetical protein
MVIVYQKIVKSIEQIRIARFGCCRLLLLATVPRQGIEQYVKQICQHLAALGVIAFANQPYDTDDGRYFVELLTAELVVRLVLVFQVPPERFTAYQFVVKGFGDDDERNGIVGRILAVAYNVVGQQNSYVVPAKLHLAHIKKTACRAAVV